MLTQLQIRNFAVIEALDLEFECGMTVLTGETGAGKSIVVDALGLILGGRADSDVIRAGSERAEISAVFALTDAAPELAALLAEQDIAADDGELLVRRSVGRDGRSRCFINGTPVPVQTLRATGELLVDIHGQHAHQSLLRREVQRKLLDEFGGLHKELSATAAACRDWRTATRALADLGTEGPERDAQLTLLRYQASELREAAPQEGEFEALDAEHRRLANSSRLLEGLGRLLTETYEGDESLYARLGALSRELAELQRLDPALAEPGGLLDTASIQVSEAADSLRRYLDALDLDPDRLGTVERRIERLHELARKHHVAPRDLPAHFKTLEQRLRQIEGGAEQAEALRKQQAEALARYRKAAATLRKRRTDAAARFSSEVTAQMQQLGMPHGRFLAALSETPDGPPQEHGDDVVEYQVSVNPGQPERPLAKVASGGELSRISLAIQVIGEKERGIPTLIFDEVDAGIGGGTAEIVGALLRRLARGRQVLCVTHLPQVAAQGDQHLLVQKKTARNATHTQVAPLSGPERVEEIARMLGGLKISEKTRAHAREMLAISNKP